MADWLEVRDLSFTFRNRPVLAGFGCHFPTRGIVICGGPSGVGKSTLGLLLTGHLVPERGEVLVEGAPVRGPSRRTVMVSQDDDLFPWMKMAAQLDFVAAFSGAHQNWQPLAARLGLEGFSALYPREMSGGMRKRLALLRATILRPRLLVLDETLGSVEPDLRERILGEFEGVWGELGVGVVLISHDRSPAMLSRTIGEISLKRI